ncbi:uncharacterized protein [Rutidosis leptorrhynchoides]|uniref:uncharacterized protein n=1 Tax=Rutidosis leptorrhynchoides TaxID=125765 RepID=UPI003A9A1544
MKASIKFRDEQKPLFRAKIPLNIIGLPFQSGIVAGETKELSLNLATFFESGPQLKLAYRPNDSINPFSVIFKTGIGHFGSPISSSLNMSAEFNLTGGSQNPTFFVHFKPQFGDFTVKKTQSSVFKKKINSSVDSIDNELKFSDSAVNSHPPVSGAVNGVLSDVELSATTAVPVSKYGRLNFRWGVRVPGLPATDEMATVVMKKSNKSTAGISFQKLPVLLINKIGIEHVARGDCVQLQKVSPVASDVADPFLGVKKQIEIIQMENEALKKAMENLKCEFSVVKSGTNTVRVNGGDRGIKDGELKDEC